MAPCQHGTWQQFWVVGPKVPCFCHVFAMPPCALSLTYCVKNMAHPQYIVLSAWTWRSSHINDKSMALWKSCHSFPSQTDGTNNGAWPKDGSHEDKHGIYHGPRKKRWQWWHFIPCKKYMAAARKNMALPGRNMAPHGKNLAHGTTFHSVGGGYKVFPWIVSTSSF